MLQRITIAPGVTTDETPQAARPRATMANRVRWAQGRAQPVGGCQAASPDAVAGKARAVLVWETVDGQRFTAVATHAKLYALVGGALHDITPIRHEAALTGAVSTTAGSDRVTITHAGHGAKEGDTVLALCEPVGGVRLGAAGSLADPFTTAPGSPAVLVDHAGHGLSAGDMVEFSGAATVGGIDIAGTYTIRVIDADRYTIEATDRAGLEATGGGAVTWTAHWGYQVLEAPDDNTLVVGVGTAATSTATGGGAVSLRYELETGFETGVWGGGFGTGSYGTGPMAWASMNPEFNSPRTWSLTTWGENLAANPRGGGIYEWALNVSKRAVLAENAPREVACIASTPEDMLVAYGAYDENYGPLNIRWCDARRIDIWTPSLSNTAGRYKLAKGARLVGRLIMPRLILVWTDQALYMQRFTADPTSIYAFDFVADRCGLLGPNAVAELDGVAYWLSPNRTVLSYDGSIPREVPCEVKSWLWDSLTPDQHDKVWTMASREYGEVWWFFPANGAEECNRYVVHSPSEGWWSIGEWDRAAGHDRTVNQEIIMAGGDGRLYWHELKGAGDDGRPLPAMLRLSPYSIGEGDAQLQLQGFVPDFADLSVGVQVSFTAYDRPQSEDGETDGPYIITPATETVEPWLTGRHLVVEIASVEDGRSFWRAGDMQMDIIAAGSRR